MRRNLQPERYGDVLIWFELMELAKERQKAIVFVTDDEKDDWWLIVDGKKLGPRPELRQELRRHAGVEFHINTPARLMERAALQASVRVSDSNIQDAQKTADELQLRIAAKDALRNWLTAERTARDLALQTLNRASLAEQGVHNWLLKSNPSSEITRPDRGGLDFIMVENGKRTGGEVKFAPNEKMFLRRVLRDAGLRAYFEITQQRLDEFLLVLVAPDLSVAMEHYEVVDKLRDYPRPAISIGYIGELISMSNLGALKKFFEAPHRKAGFLTFR